MKQYKVLDHSDNKIKIMNQTEILIEVNRDRSSNWSDYTIQDLINDPKDVLSLTDLELLEVYNET